MNPFKSDQSKDVLSSTGFEVSLTVNIAEEDSTIEAVAIKRGHWMPIPNLHDQGKILLSCLTQLCQKHASAFERHITLSTRSYDYHNIDVFQNQPANVTDNLPKPMPKKFFALQRKGRLTSAHAFMERAVNQRIDDQLVNSGKITEVYFLDTGGQPEFHELLPPLLHGSAFHLLFFNAFQSLFEPVNVTYLHEDKGTSSINYKTTHSTIEILHQLLVSFFNVSRKSNYKSVAALFGSYIDQYGSNEKDRAIQLQHVSDSLKKQFQSTSFFQQQFLVLPKNEECPYWFQPMDNITCSEQELERIQDFLFSIMQDHFTPVFLPLTWAVFHLILRDKYEKYIGVCTMEECMNLAEDCCIPAEHVLIVLEFLHYNLGTILYYPEIESLQNYVVVNPNVLFRGISRLVSVSFMGSGPHKEAACAIRKTGEIPVNIIKVDQPISENCPLTNQHVIDLLVHFKLMHVSSEYYFMPCLLLPDKSIAPSLISFDVLDISPPSLLILFEEGFVPVGLFSGAVNGLSKKWKLDEQNRFQNRVNFIVPPGHFILRQCLKYIEVQALNISEICSEINDSVCDILNEVIDIQPHLNGTQFHIGFYCPESLESGCLHTCEYNDDNIHALICCKSPRCFDCMQLPSQYYVWFKVIVIFCISNSLKFLLTISIDRNFLDKRTSR